MSDATIGLEEMDAIRRAVRKIAELLAAQDFESVVRACAVSRISADDIRDATDKYGRRLVPPPTEAYSDLDIVKVAGSTLPTWSVRAPLYTSEEGRSDLTLDLTVTRDDIELVLELDDIHVL